MSKIDQIRNALSDGGVPELLRRTKQWSARARGTAPATPQKPKPAAAAKPASTASDVQHAEALAWFASRRGNYDRLSQAVEQYIDPDGIIFDVGANIGYFSLILAEHTGFRGTAHLFEPVPNLAELCATTLADVAFESHIHQFGLGESDATLDIFIGADGNLGWNTMVAGKAAAGMAKVSIDVKAFSGTGITDVPSFIKIDVEGAEHLVLAGMMPALTTWTTKPVILCEIGWGVSHPDWEAELAAFGDLAAIGYTSVDLDGAPLDVTTLTKTTDVLFLPSS